jgi:hypothetical protein
VFVEVDVFDVVLVTEELVDVEVLELVEVLVFVEVDVLVVVVTVQYPVPTHMSLELHTEVHADGSQPIAVSCKSANIFGIAEVLLREHDAPCRHRLISSTIEVVSRGLVVAISREVAGRCLPTVGTSPLVNLTVRH